MLERKYDKLYSPRLWQALLAESETCALTLSGPKNASIMMNKSRMIRVGALQIAEVLELPLVLYAGLVGGPPSSLGQ